jgi:hypothetical protein
MILESIKNIANKITATVGASGKILDASTYADAEYSLFPSSTNLTWVMENVLLNNTTQYLQVSFVENVSIKNITYDITADTSPIVRLYYSFDDFFFQEFKYITYTVVGNVSSDIVNQYQGQILKVETIKTPHLHTIYSLYNPTTGTAIATPLGDMDVVRTYVENERAQGTKDKIKWNYVFTFINNGTLNEEYLHTDLKVKSIRIECSEFEVPFVMSYFNIDVELAIENQPTDLSMLNETFFAPKYFNDYPLIPSISKTFLEMLNTKGSL